MVSRRTQVNPSRGNGPAAPASAAATAPGIVEGEKQAAFYDLGGTDEPELGAFDDLGADEPSSPLQAAAFVSTVVEGSHPVETGGSADVEVMEALAADAFDDTDPAELAQRIAEIRATRRPIGAFAQKLALPQRRGYHRHWFNDVAGRIDLAKANGWSHVLDGQRKPIARCVGSGRDKGAMFAFAMEIPEVFWLEDMAAKNDAAQSRIDALRSAPFRAAPGTADKSDKGKFYDPSEGDAGPLQIVKGL